MTFLARFEHSLKQEKLIFPGGKIFVACSGGPDSVALFHLLASLQKKWKFKLGLLHFNHQLRNWESDRDEHFVRRLAQRYRVPVVVGSQPVRAMAKREKFSIEEAARKARYDFFAKASKKYRISKVALAHTQDDQAETVLLRILQGTGLRGLEGIRPRIRIGAAVFVRPLLGFSKKEILGFLKINGMEHCRDTSNQSLRFVRNLIRIKLLPQLRRQFNPRIVETLARIPAIVRGENQLLGELERFAWKRLVKRRLEKRLDLDRAAFLKFPRPLQFRVLEKGLKHLDEKSGMSFDAWQRIQPHLTRKRYRHSLPRDIDLLLTPLKVTLYKKQAKA